ncbi:MAG: flagellar export protein FliJ [Deltaproteobacteria bacterium]|nr:flagellar export protein FliJ [Deltaproteobacteria bacterium]
MMYKFSLEPVLKHRKLLEQDLQKDFAALKRQLLVERERLSDFERVRDRFSGELQEKQVKSISVSDILLYTDFLQQVSKEIEKQSEKIREAEKSVDQKREELIGAMKNRKTIDRLREKGLKAHLQNLAKKEQNLMNEAAINIFNKKKYPS